MSTSTTKPNTYYAQNREDMILHTLLWGVKKGFYVDVGANHPEDHSVTKFFYDNGWSGINVEPIPHLHKQLSQRRKRDINLNIGVSDKEGVLSFREYTDGRHGLSTFSSDMQDRVEGNYNQYEVKVQTLKSVFQKQKVTHIDFLKVDVEGFEYEVLASNDWDTYRPTVIVVENTPGKWSQLLKQVGYKEAFFDGLNRYFVLKSASKSNSMTNFHHVLTGDFQTSTEAQLKKLLLIQGAKLQEMYELHTQLGKEYNSLIERLAKRPRAKVKRLAKRIRSRLVRYPYEES